jgi:hypothetical protein
MTNDMKQGRQSGVGEWIKILAAVGVVLLGGLIYLLIGGIFSGIGVPLWVSGLIAAAIIVPLTVGCVVKWDKLYGVYTSGNSMETLRLSRTEKKIYGLMSIVLGIPAFFKNLGLSIWNAIKGAFSAIGNEFADIGSTFVHGDWKTKISFVIMGFGCLARGQILRGLLFLLFEVVFIGYMLLAGGYG